MPGVKGNAPPVSVPHDKTPFVDFTSQAAAPRLETVRLVVEARPVLETLKSVVVAFAVEDAMVKSVVVVSPLLAWMDNFVNGEDVPMPSRLFVLSQKSCEDVAIADEPLPKRMEPALREAQPVPPLATVSADARESEPLTVRLVPESAVGAPHWKITPYIVMALPLCVRMRYFMEVPDG